VSEQPQTPETGGDAAGVTPADAPAPLEPTPGSTAYAGEPVTPSAPATPESTPAPPRPAAAAPPPPPPPPGPAASPAGTAAGADRPEIAVGAAFAGGLLFAMILKRLAR
jgi:hypothetical protein